MSALQGARGRGQGFFSLPQNPLPPSPDQSDHSGEKRNLQLGKSGQAIFGTPSFGSKTPSPPPPLPPPAQKKPWAGARADCVWFHATLPPVRLPVVRQNAFSSTQLCGGTEHTSPPFAHGPSSSQVFDTPRPGAVARAPASRTPQPPPYSCSGSTARLSRTPAICGRSSRGGAHKGPFGCAPPPGAGHARGIAHDARRGISHERRETAAPGTRTCDARVRLGTERWRPQCTRPGEGV